MVNNLTIMSPFLNKPFEKLHLADLSRETNIPHPTARLHLEELVNENILIKTHKGRLTLYELNFNNHQLIDYLTILEKQKLIKKCDDLLFNELVEELKKLKKDCLIFGSASKNLKKATDIDIIILSKKIPKKIENISKKLNKNLHCLNIISLNQINSALRAEILNKHLIVNGTERFLKWLIKN